MYIYTALPLYIYKVRVNQSHYSPGQALRFPGLSDSQISRQSTHECGKVVSPMHRPPLPPGNISGTHFCCRLSKFQGHSAVGRHDTIGDRTRELLACNAVPRSNAPPLNSNRSKHTRDELSYNCNPLL